MSSIISIYQLRRDLDNYGDLYCNTLAYIQKRINLKRELNSYYQKIYEYTMETKNKNTDAILDIIYKTFTTNIPDDYRGRRLDISDIVFIDDDMFFRDSYGFQYID